VAAKAKIVGTWTWALGMAVVEAGWRPDCGYRYRQTSIARRLAVAEWATIQ
jgi:hypothetical protein